MQGTTARPVRRTMPPQAYDLSRMAEGRPTIFRYNKKTGVMTPLASTKNLILYSGADILAQVLAGNGEYAVNAMYLEFKNLAVPGTVVPPGFDRTGGIAYYNGLIASPDVDFIRVALMTHPDISASGAHYDGNQVLFTGMTEGSVGFHGKIFSNAAGSAVYGAALVAAPDLADQSKDVVFSRVYAGIGTQLKESGYEIGVTWPIRFG